MGRYSLDNTDLKNEFKSIWDSSVVPVQFPGLDGLYTGDTTPRIADKNTVDKWASWTIVHNDAEQEDLSLTPIERRSGTMVVQLFGKVATVNAVQDTLLLLSDTIATAFSYQTINNFVFESVSITDLGEVGDGWYQITTKIPWFRLHQ
jgi:hypothetical protein